MKRSWLVLLLLLPDTLFAQQVPRDAWIEEMKTLIPGVFCSNGDTYFRQCFDAPAEKCEEVASSAARLCLQRFESQIPDLLNQPRDGTLWGQRIGSCSGTIFERSLLESRIDSARCNDISNWQ